jgi:hypothetical protein
MSILIDVLAVPYSAGWYPVVLGKRRELGS